MSRIRRSLAGAAVAGVAALALTGLGVGTAVGQEQTPPPVASIDELTGESTSVALDSGFVEALTSLEVTPGPVGDATVEDGTATFPITGGNVTVYEPGAVDPYVQGMIMHQGSGLSLTKGDTEVELTDFAIDPGNPAVLTGKVTAGGEVVAESVKLFDLDGSTLEPISTDAEAGTATLTGTTVNLSQEAATALNEAFKTDALQGGTTVGIATITVALPGQMDEMPAGGVDTGGGSTSGVEQLGLFGAGAAALFGAGAVAYVVRRRTVSDQS